MKNIIKATLLFIGFLAAECQTAETSTTSQDVEGGFMCKPSSSVGCPLGVESTLIDGQYVCHNCRYRIRYGPPFYNEEEIKCSTDIYSNSTYTYYLGALPSCDDAPTEPVFPAPSTSGLMCKASSVGCPLGVESTLIDGQYLCHNCRYRIRYGPPFYDKEQIKCSTEIYSSSTYTFYLPALPPCSTSPASSIGGGTIAGIIIGVFVGVILMVLGAYNVFSCFKNKKLCFKEKKIVMKETGKEAAEEEAKAVTKLEETEKESEAEEP